MRGVDTYLAIKEQTGGLTVPRPMADLASGDFLAFNSEGLSGRQQTIQNNAIRRQAMQSRAYTANGTVEAGGTIEFTATNTVLAKLLPLIFHSKTGSEESATGAAFTLTDGGELTPFTVYVGFDGPEGEFARQFVGAKVNRATLSARVNEMLQMSLDVAAIDKRILAPGDPGYTAVVPSYPSPTVEYGYVFSQANVKLKAGDMATLAVLPVESFELSLDHQLATDKYRLGSEFRRSLQEGVTRVEGSFTLDAAAIALSGGTLNLAGGVTHDPAFLEKAARNAVYAALEFEVVVPTRTFDPDGAGPGTPVECLFKIELPFVKLEEPDFNVRDSSIITGTARFMAYESITATHRSKLS